MSLSSTGAFPRVAINGTANKVGTTSGNLAEVTGTTFFHNEVVNFRNAEVPSTAPYIGDG